MSNYALYLFLPGIYIEDAQKLTEALDVLKLPIVGVCRNSGLGISGIESAIRSAKRLKPPRDVAVITLEPKSNPVWSTIEAAFEKNLPLAAFFSEHDNPKSAAKRIKTQLQSS